jgi:inosine-uridine nucleoside N-ribohydrolase
VILTANSGGVGASDLPILLDVAPGNEFSDVFAIVQAVRTPGLSVVGITTSYFDTQEETRTVLKLLDLVGRPDIPVAAGQSIERKPSPIADWSKGYRERSPSPETAADLILNLSRQYPGDLEIVASGSLTNIGAALKADPTLAGRLGRIYVNDVDLTGELGENFKRDAANAGIVFSTTIPLTLFDKRAGADLVLTRGRIQKIAASRSELSDALLELAVRFAEKSGHPGTPISLSTCLPVAYASTPAYTDSEEKKLQFVEGRLFENEDPPSRMAKVATSTHPQAVYREIVGKIDDARLDFSAALAQLVLDFPKFTPAALARVQERLAKGMAVPEQPKEMPDSEKFRVQLLSYIEQYLDMLKSLDDPTARESYGRFRECFARMADIGWRFPDAFYENWHFDSAPGKPLALRFGVANSANEKMTDIHVSLGLGGQTETREVGEATGEVVFDFSGAAYAHLDPPPATAEISARFRCRDIPFSLKKKVSIRPLPAVELASVRCATSRVELEVAPNWDNPKVEMYTISGNVEGASEAHALRSRMPAPACPIWVSLPIERMHPDKMEVGWLKLLGDGMPAESAPLFHVLLPTASSSGRIEPNGPSKSPCFAVERQGRWGWATNLLKGREAVEFRVLPHGIPEPSTGPIRVAVEYFSEGDDFDSFRIEAATESAVYKPVTAWSTKPESRQWRKDVFRASPMTEAMFRQGTLRWLRVASGKDGDEIVRSFEVSFEPPAQK